MKEEKNRMDPVKTLLIMMLLFIASLLVSLMVGRYFIPLPQLIWAFIGGTYQRK